MLSLKLQKLGPISDVTNDCQKFETFDLLAATSTSIALFLIANKYAHGSRVNYLFSAKSLINYLFIFSPLYFGAEICMLVWNFIATAHWQSFPSIMWKTSSCLWRQISLTRYFGAKIHMMNRTQATKTWTKCTKVLAIIKIIKELCLQTAILTPKFYALQVINSFKYIFL